MELEGSGSAFGLHVRGLDFGLLVDDGFHGGGDLVGLAVAKAELLNTATPQLIIVIIVCSWAL